jgi:hypothetical protein
MNIAFMVEGFVFFFSPRKIKYLSLAVFGAMSSFLYCSSVHSGSLKHYSISDGILVSVIFLPFSIASSWW